MSVINHVYIIYIIFNNNNNNNNIILCYLFTTENDVATGSPQHYCTETTSRTCEIARFGWGKCNLAHYTTALPTPFQYFSDSADKVDRWIGGWMMIDG